MAYVYCAACETKHRNIEPEEIKVILDAYTHGQAQIVTTIGVFHLCVLTLIGFTNDRNERKLSRGQQPIGLGV